MDSLYYKYLTFENLLSVYYQVKKTCKNRRKIRRFDMNLYANIYNILDELKNLKYYPKEYNIFVIHEKKTRIVISQTVKDKIVNHFISKYYLIPLLENKLIYQNVATRKNKGTKLVDKLMLDYLSELNKSKKEIYALKLDIHKYFYSIDINILFDMLSFDIKDNNVLIILKRIINESSKAYVRNKVDFYNHKYNLDIPLYTINNGLSIGAMSSQFLAIYYLNKIDHFIKEKLNII